MNPTFEINGYVIVLHWVRNVYPVEKGNVGWEFGFKFTDGFYETFSFSTESEARKTRAKLIASIDLHWGRP